VSGDEVRFEAGTRRAAADAQGGAAPLRELPIGIFDSGVGGLTVLRAVRERLPRERFLYLGDTARLPYGTKSAESVRRYSLQAADLLLNRGIKYLLVACNTASAVALDALRERYAPLPVMGVIDPGAEAACAASRSRQIAVVATEGTIRGGAYQRSINARMPDALVVGRACSLFVALAEEGWTDGPIVEAVARRYLDELFERHPAVDTAAARLHALSRVGGCVAQGAAGAGAVGRFGAHDGACARARADGAGAARVGAVRVGASAGDRQRGTLRCRGEPVPGRAVCSRRRRDRRSRAADVRVTLQRSVAAAPLGAATSS